MAVVYVRDDLDNLIDDLRAEEIITVMVYGHRYGEWGGCKV
jgi:hypothetical protein